MDVRPRDLDLAHAPTPSVPVTTTDEEVNHQASVPGLDTAPALGGATSTPGGGKGPVSHVEDARAMSTSCDVKSTSPAKIVEEAMRRLNDHDLDGYYAGATALAQARDSGTFSEAHEAFWAEARRRLGDGVGTKAFIVLLLHRKLPAAAIVAGIHAAVSAGSVDPSVVAVEARRVASATTGTVVPIGALERYDRPTPGLGGYDELLDAEATA